MGIDGRVLFDRTVPRQLVHRTAVSEVVLTDVCVLGETSFQIGAQWPRGHSFFGLAGAPYHDPMILAACYRDGARVGSGEVRWSCVPPKVYTRLRGGRDIPGQFIVDVPEPVPPSLVGRERSLDVVLPVGGTFSFDHYIEFDRPAVVTAVRHTPDDAVEVLFEQSGQVVARGALDISLLA